MISYYGVIIGSIIGIYNRIYSFIGLLAGASTGLDWVVQQSSADELKGSLKDLAPDLRTKLQKALLRGRG